jgi:hypothetical protein
VLLVASALAALPGSARGCSDAQVAADLRQLCAGLQAPDEAWHYLYKP